MKVNESDENEDIILPDTLWGELAYIYFILVEILKNPKASDKNFAMLCRQIKFFIRWQKIK